MLLNTKPRFNSVLIIDDSEIDVLVNRRLMELTFFASNIIVTTNAEDALLFFQHECSSEKSVPDLIFLDMHLPMMSGFEFIEEFKKLPAFITEKSKIIILSVFQKQENLQKVLEYKFVAGQLEKPLTQKSLREITNNDSVTVNVFS